MSRIREDLGGVIHIGGGLVLRAGDEVPPGARVSRTWMEPEPGGSDPHGQAPERPHGNAKIADWRAYATQIGIEVPEGADKATIRQLVADQEG